MPTLIPNQIPPHIQADPKRNAERMVYQALAESLDDRWTVFGWVAWVCRRAGGGHRDGEADFIVAHPDQGALVLEVKGGAISRDPARDQWCSRGRDGVFAIKNPFEQAKGCFYTLKGKLCEAGINDVDRFVPGYGVVFPQCASPNGDLGPDAPREIVVAGDDLGSIGRRVPQMIDYWRGRISNWSAPGARGIEAIKKVLARPFELEARRMASIAEDARQILTLSADQYHVLDQVARNRRVIVTGGPGTGKTLLAIEKARRLAGDEGFKTLLTCFNRPLADHFRQSTRDVPNLAALSFHQYCHQMATRAGLPAKDPDENGLSSEYYRAHLPNLLLNALDTLPDRFDAIVLDEGQDFGELDRTALELSLAEQGDGVFYVFQDPAQAVYRDTSPWPEDGFVPVDLHINHRNTRSIHGTLQKLGTSTAREAIGPEGREVVLIQADDARAEREALSRVLHQLIRNEGLSADRIAVLVSTRSAIPDLAPDGRVGAFEITEAHEPHPHRVLMDSVTRFKGLERDAVVLVGLREVDYCNFEPLLCVGASRARAHLVVIGGGEVVGRFGGRWRAAA